MPAEEALLLRSLDPQRGTEVVPPPPPRRMEDRSRRTAPGSSTRGTGGIGSSWPSSAVESGGSQSNSLRYVCTLPPPLLERAKLTPPRFLPGTQKFLVPHLQPPTETDLEASQRALEAKYDEAASLLKTLQESTDAVATSLDEQRADIDKELQEVRDAVAEMREGEKKRDEWAKNIGRQVDEMAKSLPGVSTPPPASPPPPPSLSVLHQS